MAKNTLTSLRSLVRDEDRVPVQIGSSFQTSDATTVPQTSPLAYAGTEIALTVPDRAVELIVNPSTALRIYETTGSTSYDVIAAASKEAVPCARMTTVYIVRDSASGTLNFRWTLV